MGEGGGRGRVWGVRVDVIEELKSFWENSQIKISGGRGRFGGGGVRVDANEELKFLCKFNFFFFFFFGGGGGGGSGGGGVRFGESGWM